MKKDDIKIKGYRGTWYVIATAYSRCDRRLLYLLEHEQYGDMAASLIVYVNKVTNEIEIELDDVWNGFAEYAEYEGIDEDDLIIYEGN